jgi:hypothetical protein
VSAHHPSAAHAFEAMVQARARDLRPVIEAAVRDYGMGVPGETKEAAGKRLRMHLAEYIAERLAVEFLPLKGWTCSACAAFCGEEKERLSACRTCGLARR